MQGGLWVTFCLQEHRDTILELERQEAEEVRRLQEKARQVCAGVCVCVRSCPSAVGLLQLEQRKIESKHMVADIIRREEAEQKAMDADEVWRAHDTP